VTGVGLTRAAGLGRLFSLTGLAGIVVAVALVVAALRVPDYLRLAWDSVDAPGKPLEQRDLGFALGWQSRQAMTEAARVLPRDATYTVVLGESPPPSDLERAGIVTFLRSWLLPRRYTPDLHQAQWVIAYHHSSETIGVPYRKEIGLAPFVNTFRVVR
jgi:hypothetical protein